MVGTADGRKARWTARKRPFSQDMFPMALSRNCPLGTEKWDGPAHEANPPLPSGWNGQWEQASPLASRRREVCEPLQLPFPPGQAPVSDFNARDRDGNRVDTLYPQKLLRLFTTCAVRSGGLNGPVVGGGVGWEGRPNHPPTPLLTRSGFPQGHLGDGRPDCSPRSLQRPDYPVHDPGPAPLPQSVRDTLPAIGPARKDTPVFNILSPADAIRRFTPAS